MDIKCPDRNMLNFNTQKVVERCQIESQLHTIKNNMSHKQADFVDEFNKIFEQHQYKLQK